MLILNDFDCPSCERHMEMLTSPDVVIVPCECGAMAFKRLSAPTIKLEGCTGAFPTAADRWVRVHEENARVKNARNR